MALLLATRHNRIEIVEFLLSIPESPTIQRINVNLRDKNGWTALIIASGNGFTEIVRLLISRPETNVNIRNEEGWTAFMLASWQRHKEIVKLLLLRPDLDIFFKIMIDICLSRWSLISNIKR